jgi:hypothetical protein
MTIPSLVRMKYTCPYCDSAFLQFITSEEQLREHIMQAHGRELSFTRKQLGQMPERSEEETAKTD